MRAPDPFAGFEGDVNYWELPDETAELTVENHALPEDDRQLRFLVYAGLFDLLVEALAASAETNEELEGRLFRILGKFQSVEPTLRFSLFDRGKQAEGLELITRMRGKDIVLTQEWLLPRLERDIGVYQSRIVALQAALEEKQG
jgi:hypothetical protein